MKKDHKKQIEKILLYHQNPAEQLAEYHKREAEGIIRKNDVKWFIICFITLTSWIIYIGVYKACNEQVFKSCKTSADSIQVVDSLTNF